jgi:hypothetical protein
MLIQTDCPEKAPIITLLFPRMNPSVISKFSNFSLDKPAVDAVD